MAARRRRSPLTAASGSTQIAYHGSSQAVDSSSASVAPAGRHAPVGAARGAPQREREHDARSRRGRGGATSSACRCSPTRRAVSAGMLCVATSCCCSPTASRKPSACAPKPISADDRERRAGRRRAAQHAARARARRGGASTRNGSTQAGGDLDAHAGRPSAHRGAARAPARARAPVVSASASASASSSSVSLCAPPTASTSSTGFRPTNAAAQRRRVPEAPGGARDQRDRRRGCETTAIALNAHSPPASPSGASA